MYNKELVLEVLQQIENAAEKILARFHVIKHINDFTDNPDGVDFHIKMPSYY